MKRNFDSFEIVSVRPGGGLRGIESVIVARKFGIGSPESQTQTSVSNLQTTVQGGAAGSTTVAVGAGAHDVSVTSADPAVVASAFQFGSETNAIAAQEVGAGNATIEQIAGELSQITAAAAPQSGAFQSEVSQQTTGDTTNKVIAYGTGIAALIAVLAFLKGGKRV